jgi:hypothetical protein
MSTWDEAMYSMAKERENKSARDAAANPLIHEKFKSPSARELRRQIVVSMCSQFAPYCAPCDESSREQWISVIGELWQFASLVVIGEPPDPLEPR